VAAAADSSRGPRRCGCGSGRQERVEELPLVREAHARRLDPLSVVVEVEERQPELVVVGDGERRYLDRDGVVIDDVRPGRSRRLRCR
jgi:cell division septal protein FtsQ